MRKIITQVKALAPGLLLLVAIAAGIWWVVARLATLFQSLRSDLAVTVVVACIAGSVSILSLALSKAYERRAAIRQDLRTKKLPVYEGIVKTLFAVMFAEKIGKEPVKPDELVKWFAETTERLSIWGSDDLVLAFNQFKNSVSPQDPSLALFGFEDLLLAIRKDLGHTGRKLKRGSILRLFITDIDDHLKKK